MMRAITGTETLAASVRRLLDLVEGKHPPPDALTDGERRTLARAQLRVILYRLSEQGARDHEHAAN